jgi:hypothetical protein
MSYYDKLIYFFLNFKDNFKLSVTNIEFIFLFYSTLLTFLFIIGICICCAIRKFSEQPDYEVFTLSDLEKYNEVDNYFGKIYISIRGRIFE